MTVDFTDNSSLAQDIALSRESEARLSAEVLEAEQRLNASSSADSSSNETLLAQADDLRKQVSELQQQLATQVGDVLCI